MLGNIELIRNGDSTPADEVKKYLIETVGTIVDVTLTSAEILALNATPITILAAPGAGLAYIVERVEAYKPAGTAYAGIAAGEDLTIKYTNASGTAVATLETTGFLDQATAQTRSVRGLSTDVTPVANAALVAHLLTGEITTGDTVIKLRIKVRIVKTVW